MQAFPSRKNLLTLCERTPSTGLHLKVSATFLIVSVISDNKFLPSSSNFLVSTASNQLVWPSKLPRGHRLSCPWSTFRRRPRCGPPSPRIRLCARPSRFSPRLQTAVGCLLISEAKSGRKAGWRKDKWGRRFLFRGFYFL